MTTDYISVTEIAGDDVTQEQVERLCNRYYWAGRYCSGKDVLEAACGTGQGLGYLSTLAKSIEAGDYSMELLTIAKKHYGSKINLSQFDAQKMPFDDNSKDIVILFEAIYYIPEVNHFFSESRRILKADGKLLLATANKDLFDFNPSPYSYKYFGTTELKDSLEKHGFKVELFGDTPVDEITWLQKILRHIKKIVVKYNLMPKTMAGKKLLKRLVFGKLIKMPAEISSNTSIYIEPQRISADAPDTTHKVIYCCATL